MANTGNYCYPLNATGPGGGELWRDAATGRTYEVPRASTTRQYSAPSQVTNQTSQTVSTPSAPSTPSGPSAEELARQQYEAQVRSNIERGYSSYESELDKMLNEGLPGQQSALATQAKSQYESGIADLSSQLTEGQQLLQRQAQKTETSQARNLKDLAANLRNSFMAGNVFLGARGAGDSSAANQYAYALTKLGSQQRGDIMRQTQDIMTEIGDREARLQNIYNTELNNIKSEYETKSNQISQWFYEQQNALRSQKGQLAVAKGQDLATLSQNLLNQALAQINFIKEQAANRQSMLDQWAMNNANTINEVKANLSSVANYNPALPQAQPIASAPQMSGGNIFANAAYTGGGGSVYSNEEDKRYNPLGYNNYLASQMGGPLL